MIRLKPYQWLNTVTGEIMDTDPRDLQLNVNQGKSAHINWKSEQELFGSHQVVTQADLADARAPKFQTGQIVRLKSGGPLMTVWGNDDLVGCQWFDGNTLQTSSFVEGTLELEEKPA
jgi:uncharacterized protein YodC (DUF2158 family)